MTGETLKQTAQHRIIDLVWSIRAEREWTRQELIDRLMLGGESQDAIERRLGKKTRLTVDHALKMAELLAIEAERMHEAMFGAPLRADVEARLSAAAEDLALIVEDIRASTETNPTAQLVTRLMSTGRWATTIRPLFRGPTPGISLHYKNHLMARLLRGAGPGRTARQQFMADASVRGVLPDLAFLDLGPKYSFPDFPDLTRETDLIVSLPVLAQGMGRPAPNATVLDPFETVIVVSLLEESGPSEVAVIIARALGWSLVKSDQEARLNGLAPSPELGTGEGYARARTTIGLRQLRVALSQSRRHQVFWHRGLPVRLDDGSYHEASHPLLDEELVELMPGHHVVFLVPTEEQIDRVIAVSSSPTAWAKEQFVAWCAAAAERCARLGGQVIQVEPAPLSATGHPRWSRHARVSDEALARLVRRSGRATLSVPIVDDDARRVLQSAQPLRWI